MGCNCAKKSSEKWQKFLYEKKLKADLEKKKLEKEKDNEKDN